MKIYDAMGNIKMGQLYCDKVAKTKTAQNDTVTLDTSYSGGARFLVAL
ncbi:MAG: hypothetical protein ACI3Y0_04595 [Prevotella sp.]